MRKGYTLFEVLIAGMILCFLALLLAVFLTRKPSWQVRLDRCFRNGYTLSEQHPEYCIKTQNGNTIIIHVDSLR